LTKRIYQNRIVIVIPFRYASVGRMNERVRERARRIIEEKALTQEEIAKLAGIKQATVSRLLTGRLGKVGAWEKLLDALGLELIAVPKGASEDQPTAEKG
jgi:transcriptional regulator with XRE-family HTH domain